MKQKYNGISVYVSEALEKTAIEHMRLVSKAVVDSALMMRDNARKQFVANAKGYKLSSIADGVMIGKFRRAPDGTRSITIHAFGNNTNKNSWKARLFAGGAYHRYTRKTNRYRGSVEDLHTIESVLDQKILDKNLKEALR